MHTLKLYSVRYMLMFKIESKLNGVLSINDNTPTGTAFRMPQSIVSNITLERLLQSSGHGAAKLLEE